MKYTAETRTLAFGSQEELEQFHAELVVLLRSAMITATRRIRDDQQAKLVSREVMRDNRAVMRALNLVRTGIARKTF